MRLTIAPLAALTIAALLTGVAGREPPLGKPHLIGTVTGDAERDTYGFAVFTVPTEVVCIVGPPRSFGTVTGDPEKDTFAAQTVRVQGRTCPSPTTAKR